MLQGQPVFDHRRFGTRVPVIQTLITPNVRHDTVDAPSACVNGLLVVRGGRAMADNVRVGVIGTSWWADLVHLPTLTSHPGARVVAICGRNADRAAEMANKYAIPQVFTDYRALIERAQGDALVISTPDDTHYPITMEALEAGLHVVCEKPLALTAGQAQEMYERALAAGVKHMTFFTWRWLPLHRYLHELVEDGYLGRPFHGQWSYVGDYARE